MFNDIGMVISAQQIDALAGSYNPALVAFSLIVAVMASYTALYMASRITQSSGSSARWWLTGGAFAMGSGIWSMHFVGMLAYSLPIRMAYDFLMIMESLLIAIATSGLVLLLVSRSSLGTARLLMGGLLMGIGISAMHYTGMAAMRMDPAIRYDPVLFLVSVLIAMGASIVALWLAFTLRARMTSREPVVRLLASIVMGLAISGMHYTGMASANFEVGSISRVNTSLALGESTLGISIGGAIILVLLIALLVSEFDQRQVLRSAFMLRQVEHANARLNDNVVLLHSIIETAFDAYIAMDSAGRIQDWNRQAERTFGYTRDAVLGRTLSDIIIPAQHRKAHEQGFKRYLETGESRILNRRIELSAMHQNGSEFPVELTVWVTQMEGQLRFNSFVNNISERRRLTEGLNRSNRELEQFAYIASHDLQAPLRAMKGFAELLKQKQQDQPDSETNEFIELIMDGADDMKKLIEGLLNLSRVGHERLIIQNNVELQYVVEEAKKRLQVTINDCDASITCNPNLPQVSVDQLLTVQLLQNLLSNAIKYQGVKPTQVYIDAERIGEEWVVSVADNSIGIDQKDHKRIFGIFQQLDPKERHDGSGIGLAICERIVHLHGGRIWLESQLGKGSTFYFSIPDQPDTATPAEHPNVQVLV